MKPHSMTCDIDLLRMSLDDMLSDQQEEELSLHLSACSACQRELERMAAERQDWCHVGEVLRRERKTPLLRTRSDDELDAGDDHADSLTDFAIHFLEPSSTAGMMGRLGDIEILEIIGRGGMGFVLKGYQTEFNRSVAVKILNPHLAASGAARKRFAREAQAAAIIVHPNVMPILAVHGSAKLPHIVMPFIACESLEERIQREGPFEPVDILRVGLQVAAGLAVAHSQGLVHRDIKPANILLEKGVDRVLLTDFGLARAVDDAALTRTGVIAGTPQYMSPEQARGDAVDARSDLFSLGSVLYAMCTGRPPFRAESSFGVLRRITDRQPRPIREINSLVPAWLVLLIDKLHAKDPQDRFQSAAELAKILEQCVAHVQQPTITPLPTSISTLSNAGSNMRDGSWRNWRVALSITLGVALSLALAVVFLTDRWNNREAEPASGRISNDAVASDASNGTATSLTHLWDDGVAEELNSVTKDTQDLARRAAQLIDKSTVGESTDPPRELPSMKENLQ